MKAPVTRMMECQTDATLRSVDAISVRLYHLGKTLELAAFAAEARRVLSEIDQACLFRPKLKKVMDEGIDARENWKCLEDASGEVLRELANQAQEINAEFTDAAYSLASHQQAPGKPAG